MPPMQLAHEIIPTSQREDVPPICKHLLVFCALDDRVSRVLSFRFSGLSTLCRNSPKTYGGFSMTRSQLISPLCCSTHSHTARTVLGDRRCMFALLLDFGDVAFVPVCLREHVWLGQEAEDGCERVSDDNVLHRCPVGKGGLEDADRALGGGLDSLSRVFRPEFEGRGGVRNCVNALDGLMKRAILLPSVNIKHMHAMVNSPRRGCASSRICAIPTGRTQLGLVDFSSTVCRMVMQLHELQRE